MKSLLVSVVVIAANAFLSSGCDLQAGGDTSYNYDVVYKDHGVWSNGNEPKFLSEFVVMTNTVSTHTPVSGDAVFNVKYTLDGVPHEFTEDSNKKGQTQTGCGWLLGQFGYCFDVPMASSVHIGSFAVQSITLSYGNRTANGQMKPLSENFYGKQDPQNPIYVMLSGFDPKSGNGDSSSPEKMAVAYYEFNFDTPYEGNPGNPQVPTSGAWTFGDDTTDSSK
jgi:hypothetical protein